MNRSAIRLAVQSCASVGRILAAADSSRQKRYVWSRRKTPGLAQGSGDVGRVQGRARCAWGVQVQLVELTPNPLFHAGPRRLQLRRPQPLPASAGPSTFPRSSRRRTAPVGCYPSVVSPMPP